MAKQQTFGDKVGKAKKSDIMVVKVIKTTKKDNGATSFDEKFLKVEVNANMEKVDI